VVVIERAGEIVTLKDFDAGTPAESVTFASMVYGPAVVGVPLSTPAVLRLIPAGSPVAVQPYGGVPPAADKLAEYAAPAVPSGGDEVVMMSGGAIVTDKFSVPVALLASVTVTLTENGPAVVGVPLIVPVNGSTPRPGGSPVAVHVRGGTPPETARVVAG
jgi:hypothetical protein